METAERVGLRELQRIVYTVDKLREIAGKLHHQDENACNYGLTPRQETRVKNLEKQAEELAAELGYQVHHQTDPRGATLYLVDAGMADYSEGWAV